MNGCRGISNLYDKYKQIRKAHIAFILKRKYGKSEYKNLTKFMCCNKNNRIKMEFVIVQIKVMLTVYLFFFHSCKSMTRKSSTSVMSGNWDRLKIWRKRRPIWSNLFCNENVKYNLKIRKKVLEKTNDFTLGKEETQILTFAPALWTASVIVKLCVFADMRWLKYEIRMCFPVLNLVVEIR